MSDRARQHRHQWIAPSRWHDHDTQMCRAFLVALARWVLVNHGSPAARVVLPTGCVGVGELTLVLRALETARSNQTTIRVLPPRGRASAHFK
jgi:hypothetical protein